MRRFATLMALAAGLTLLAGCAQPPVGSSPTSASAPAEPSRGSSASVEDTQPLSGTLTVYAAASLTTSFTAMGDELMAANPGLDVQFVFAGSSDLVAQLMAGAPGDVFASADERNMTRAVDASLVADSPEPFATNHLTIVTAPGNPNDITGLADLANPDLAVVICAQQVPCGGAAQQVSDLAGITLTPVSEENSVTSVLAKVVGGEADAGLVYRTDAASAGDQVSTIDFPEADQVTNVYPIGVLAASENPSAACAFVDFVHSDAGKQILTAAGFGATAG